MELLVVIAILAVLAAIAIPLFLSQREKAAESQLLSDARNAGTNLAASTKMFPPNSPATITWDSATQTFTVGTETVPSPVSVGTTLNVGTGFDNTYWTDISYGDGSFVAVGYDRVAISNDGVTWQSYAVPNRWWEVTYGD